MRTILHNRGVMAVSLGHMSVDLFNGALPVLLASMALDLGMTNVVLGTISTIYFLISSLTQPLFGLAVDRWDSRWLGIAGLGWLLFWYAVASFLSGNAIFVAIMLASLGSGAFHPFGVMNARRSAGGRGASGMSLFFFFGQTGIALGPALAGGLLGWFSVTETIQGLLLIVLPLFLLIAWLGRGLVPPTQQSESTGGRGGGMAWTTLAIAAFVLVILFRGWPPSATTTFLPKWLGDSGFAPQQFGLLLSAFMLSQAVGNITGGWLADRWSHKGVVVASLSLAGLPFYILYLAPSVGVGTMVVTAAAGFLVGMPHSVMVLMGQNLLPGRMGFASGLMLGAMFTVGAIAGWITGWLGDWIGLSQALAWIPAICVAAAVCSLGLPRARARSHQVVATGGAD